MNPNTGQKYSRYLCLIINKTHSLTQVTAQSTSFPSVFEDGFVAAASTSARVPDSFAHLHFIKMLPVSALLL